MSYAPEDRDEPGREPEDADDGDRGGTGSEYWRAIGERRREIISVREAMVEERGTVGAAIDRMGRVLASPAFFATLLVLHLAWVVLNLGWVPGVRPWDPYPFVFLATVASAEAPFIALLILMRQHRDRRINELRDEVSLQVALHGERENTTLLRMLRDIGQRLDVEFDAEAGGDLSEELDPEALMSSVRERLEEVEEEPGDG